MGISKTCDLLVPLFHLMFLDRIRRLRCRNIKWAALAAPVLAGVCGKPYLNA